MSFLGTFIILMLLGGCATRYVVPTNRFITPETQGGFFRGQFEVQYTQGQEFIPKLNTGNLKAGADKRRIPRTGLLLSNSFADSFDLIWSHMGGSTSMIGGKVQFLGGSRSSNTTGNKLGLAFLLGGNEHQTPYKTEVRTLNSQEILVLYGYRLDAIFMPYASLSMATYKYQSELSFPSPELFGKTFKSTTAIKGLNIGTEADWQVFFVKLELSYQQMTTSNTSKETVFSYGFSGGLNW
jgi:hypothetical protein